MIVHGREVKFLRTVWAVNEIAKACPNNNINKLMDVLKSESTVTINDTWVTFVCALSNGYEMAQKYADKEYKPNPLTPEEVSVLMDDEFSSLIAEATNAWFGDKVTVEVEEPKKKEETKETSD